MPEPTPLPPSDAPTLDPSTFGLPGRAPAHPSRHAHPDAIGPYRLLSLLGQGGFGSVYLAEQSHPVRRQVAVKLLRPGMDSGEVVARFEAERQALALMDHPNVAKVFDGGTTDDGRPYFVMEHVRGVPITAFCDAHHLSLPRRLELFAQVCDAVQHAHMRGLIHRDLKPSNILVGADESAPDIPVPRVIDFGIAKALHQPLGAGALRTEVGQIIGTPEYMSPEQAGSDGQDVDTRTDVYALGVILYELLTGTLPFDSATLRDAGYERLIRTLRESEPPRPSARVSTITRVRRDPGQTAAPQDAPTTIDPVPTPAPRAPAATTPSELRGDLDWITMRAMAKDRAQRYDGPGALAADLRRHLAHRPVLAGPPTLRYRFGKYARRHRALLAAAATIALALAGGAGALAYGFVEATRGRAAAEAATAIARDEAEFAATASDFYVELIAASDPSSGSARDPTVREMLDLGAQRLDAGVLENSPRVEATLRAGIGSAFRGLGMPAEAERHLRRAVEIGAVSPTGNASEPIFALATLAQVRGEVGDVEEAKTLITRAEALASESPLTETRARLQLLSGAAWVLELEGDLEGAERVLREALTAARAGRDTVAASAQILQHLAIFAKDRGDLPEAERLCREALEEHRRTTGPDALPYGRTLDLLANILALTGDAAGAEEAARRALEIAVARVGDDHPAAAQVQRTMAYLLRRDGQPARALPFAERALATYRSVFGDVSLETADGLDALAGIRLDTGLYDDAATAWREDFAIRDALLGEDHPGLAAPLTGLADALTRAGHPEEAERHARRALALRQAAFGEAHWAVQSTRSVLGGTLVTLGKLPEARMVLLAAYAGMSTDPGTPAPRLRALLERLATLEDRAGDAAAAARWRALIDS